MSGDDDIELDYHFLTNNALKGVVRDVLALTQELGTAPGEHHFYVEFLTQAPGVSIPQRLLVDYPERMTIVLQHQFEALEVDDDHFEVTLYFKRQPARLIIPFDAVTSFADPSVQFGLRFDAPALAGPEAGSETSGETSDEARDETSGETGEGDHAPTPLKLKKNGGKAQPAKGKADIGKADVGKAGVSKSGAGKADAGKDQAGDDDDAGAGRETGAGADIVSLDAFRKK